MGIPVVSLLTLQSIKKWGFTQLAVELIALDQWTKADTPVFYGAVTTGEDWRFAIYKRQEKQII
jgi:hypothetical protein